MKINNNALKSIKSILSKNKLLTLSTSSKNSPYSNTSFYTFDNQLNLYIWSENGTIHEKNILKNNKVSINIFDSSQKWGSPLQGIQAIGIARKVKNKELMIVGVLYLKRFPKSITMVKNPRKFHDKIFDSTLYKIKLKKIKVFDEKNFGKGEYRELLLQK